jgi:hypothetical protein
LDNNPRRLIPKPNFDVFGKVVESSENKPHTQTDKATTAAVEAGKKWEKVLKIYMHIVADDDNDERYNVKKWWCWWWTHNDKTSDDDVDKCL